MLALDPENDKAIRDKELRNRALSVRRKYKASGLYLKNDATRPLWTIDWYSSAIRLSFTGEYLIADSRFLGFDESGEVDPQAEVLKFFRNGSLLSSFTARELVRDFEALPNSMSMKMWACRASFDLARNQYSVHTFEKQKLVFDATNGKLISSQKLKSIACNPLLGPIN